MSAVLDCPPAHDAVNGRFLVANRGGPGRPKGSKSFAKVLHKAAPKLAKAYVSRALKGSAPILIDSRKYFMPDVAELPSPTLAPTVVFLIKTSDGVLHDALRISEDARIPVADSSMND